VSKGLSIITAISASLVGLFCAWQLTSQTVLLVLNAQVTAAQAQAQLRACEARTAK
jgi:hypothetical protein